MGIPRNHPAIQKLLKLSSNGDSLATPDKTKNHQPLRKAGVLNKTEQDFKDLVKNEWDEILFESLIIPINRRSRCEYTPDALCLKIGKPPCFYEVKGSFWRDDARVKASMASRLIGPAEFRQAEKRRKKDGGWRIRTILGSPFSKGRKLLGEESLGLCIHFPLPSEDPGKDRVKTLKVWTSCTEFLSSGKIRFKLTPALLSQATGSLLRRTKLDERKHLDPRAFDPQGVLILLGEHLTNMIELVVVPDGTQDAKKS